MVASVMEGRRSLALMLLAAGIVGLLALDIPQHPPDTLRFSSDPAGHRMPTGRNARSFAVPTLAPATSAPCSTLACEPLDECCVGAGCCGICQLVHHATLALPATAPGLVPRFLTCAIAHTTPRLIAQGHAPPLRPPISS